ncbi:class I adenylate-forming enzyme family protein [Mycolicibacterium confluentis]|uniref:AMP-dependent ligase n=1 Tax=Mycolicibacterium confluentis TaxID=28047 RepID=A0A7I7XZY9_9MYCO|nr:AMP-binding protein [Mycolicibacterium confluentis]MCV7319857.1 AMP-binding protein [Mycolicibacterium confluentis]ORV34428.1 AMP-dependent synthetase [Mycolicibacterium confluentis]BBZ34887.1 AMP-dependent ligase [Mycolicibacterium confluentis]
MNISDFLLGAGDPTAPALTDAGHTHSYAQLRHAAGVLAAELAALGLPPGARVAVVGANSLFWVAGYLAVMKLNLVAVPITDKSTPEDVQRNVRLVECSAVLIDRRLSRRFAGALDGLAVLTDDALGSAREPHWPAASTDVNADAVLMFTSGTTNVPKAVRITHANIRANTESIITYLGLRPSDRVLVILPFYYCYGASLLHTHLRLGAHVVLCNSFVYPETAIDLLDTEQCTVFAGVPSSFQLLLRATTFTSRPLPSLRIIQQAGGKLPPVMIDELIAAQPSAEVFVMYGQTEATARLSYLPPHLLREKRGSVGRGIPGVELAVLDEEMRAVPPGLRGEIYAVGDNISPGYFRDPEGSAAKFTSHGLRTGDLAEVDQDGYIFIVDRRDDFIKSWGYRVSSQEVEAAVLRMEQLVSAAVVGVPDDEAGEAVTLFVTTRPGSDVATEDILAHCRRELAKHMVPRSVHIIDAMPLNANGKIAKTSLRKHDGSKVLSV